MRFYSSELSSRSVNNSFFYGSKKYALNVNKEIIRLSISYLKPSECFIQPLFSPTTFVFIYIFYLSF